jgi:hypothetical protein
MQLRRCNSFCLSVYAQLKDDSPRPYSEKAQISAKYPLHILAIDLYTYKSAEYFTAICIFSTYFWAQKIKDKEATTILEVYENFCAQHKEPKYLSCDNGPEFSLLKTEKLIIPPTTHSLMGNWKDFTEKLENNAESTRKIQMK